MDKKSLRFLVEAKGLRFADLARGLRVDKSTITKWSNGRIPAERVLEVERLTGISRADLRPDIYPLPVRVRASEGAAP